MNYILIILIFLFILLFGGKIKKLNSFRQVMVSGMIPAAVIGLICFASYALSLFQKESIMDGLVVGSYAFCLSSMGIAFSRKISGFEPLPVLNSFFKKSGRIRQLFMMLLFSVIIAVLMGVIGFFIFKVCLVLFHESDKSAQAINSLPTQNKFMMFPLLLAEAGIAEEAMFRLFTQSCFWRFFKNSWVAIVLSSLCFSLYHLLPINIMYKVYWGYPFAQFTTVFIKGLILGYFFKKRGFETVVLGHTLADYIGVLGV